MATAVSYCTEQRMEEISNGDCEDTTPNGVRKRRLSIDTANNKLQEEPTPKQTKVVISTTEPASELLESPSCATSLEDSASTGPGLEDLNSPVLSNGVCDRLGIVTLTSQQADPEQLKLIKQKMEFKTSFSFSQNESQQIEAGVSTTNDMNQDRWLRAIHAGVYSHQGQKDSMEDVYTLIPYPLSGDIHKKSNGRSRFSFCSREAVGKSSESISSGSSSEENEEATWRQHSSTQGPVAFFGICDGHGGVQAAEFVNAYLHHNIQSQTTFYSDTEKAIVDGFLKTEQDFTDFALENSIDGSVGTTATTIVILGSTLYVANIGDSEVVLSCNGKAVPLTESHKPDSPKEQQRVLAVGGVLVTSNKRLRLGHPVWNPKLINIGVTRAIGDLYFKLSAYVKDKQSGLSAEPFVLKRHLTRTDEFLILATDGFWDVVSHQEAVNFVRQNLDKDIELICKELLDLSRNRYSTDNITVVVVKF